MKWKRLFGIACIVLGAGLALNSIMAGPDAFVWEWYAVAIGVLCGLVAIVCGILWMRPHQ